MTEELQQVSDERRELENYVEQVNQELEEKNPALQQLRRDHDRAVLNCDQLLGDELGGAGDVLTVSHTTVRQHSTGAGHTPSSLLTLLQQHLHMHKRKSGEKIFSESQNAATVYLNSTRV